MSTKNDERAGDACRIRQVEARDLDRCYRIETESYEGDEAATRDKIRIRIETFPQAFLVAEMDGEVAGFINAGAADVVEMEDEAFKELVGHDPDGAHLVILSVVVHPDWQGRGLAGALMRAFVERARQWHKISIQLMCRERHVPLYEKLGYAYVRPSPSLHGGMAWHEMQLLL